MSKKASDKSEAVGRHLAIAHRNLAFYTEVCEKIPDSFHDWKVTVLFYSALHMLRALIESCGHDSPESHGEMIKMLSKNGVCPVKEHVFNSYKRMRVHSEAARYGHLFKGKAGKEYLENEHQKAEKDLRVIASYLEERGLL